MTRTADHRENRDIKYEKEIALNRDKLRSIVDSIIFLGRLNIAFRAHCDDSQYHPTIGKYYVVGGVGNFIELLNYRIRGGDKVLEHYFNSCAKNASYISNSSQNELISYCGQYIQNILVSKIKENQFFSIIADEASDCSNQKLLSLVIRFIDKSYDVREEFMGFLHCQLGLTGEALCKTILFFLKNFLLDISNCRESRQNLLEVAITERCPLATKKKLIDVRHTVWVKRVTGLDDFENLFVPIVFCLEGMSFNLESKLITRTVFDYTIPVTQMLLGKTFDICDGLGSISALKSYISTLRSLIDDYHIKWYASIICLASKVDVAEAKLRILSRQINRNNVASSSTSDYFKKSLSIPLIDHLLGEVNYRFSDDALAAYDGLYIMQYNYLDDRKQIYAVNIADKIYLCITFSWST
nr:52 kDa repressor of the inhibitor of the protein kinase-like [Hydra vulgaris]